MVSAIMLILMAAHYYSKRCTNFEKRDGSFLFHLKTLTKLIPKDSHPYSCKLSILEVVAFFILQHLALLRRTSQRDMQLLSFQTWLMLGVLF